MHRVKRVKLEEYIYDLVLSAGLGPRRLGSCSEKLEASAGLQMWAACRTGQSPDGSLKGRERVVAVDGPCCVAGVARRVGKERGRGV